MFPDGFGDDSTPDHLSGLPWFVSGLVGKSSFWRKSENLRPGKKFPEASGQTVNQNLGKFMSGKSAQKRLSLVEHPTLAVEPFRHRKHGAGQGDSDLLEIVRFQTIGEGTEVGLEPTKERQNPDACEKEIERAWAWLYGEGTIHVQPIQPGLVGHLPEMGQLLSGKAFSDEVFPQGNSISFNPLTNECPGN